MKGWVRGDPAGSSAGYAAAFMRRHAAGIGGDAQRDECRIPAHLLGRPVLVGILLLPSFLLGQFLPVDLHFLGKVERKANLVAVNLDHPDHSQGMSRVADYDFFTDASGQS